MEVHIPGTEQAQAFQELKKRMMEQPILKLPEWDQPFFIICDASQTGIGAVVAQEHDGFEHPIEYFSKSLTPSQRNYHSYKLEVLALVQALKAFDSYTWGTDLKVVTDCRALAHWNSTATVLRHVFIYLVKFRPSILSLSTDQGL